jgi:hypothetical protein
MVIGSDFERKLVVEAAGISGKEILWLVFFRERLSGCDMDGR